MTGRRVLLVQPSLQPPGGGNGVAAWMLEALRGEHPLALLTWEAPDLDAINRFFGTSLSRGDFALHTVAMPVRRGFACVPLPLALLKDAYLMRIARHMAADYDVVISVNNEADLGKPGIQYVHYPRLDPLRPEVDLRWYHRSEVLLRVYRRAVLAVTGFSVERMRRNRTVVNSDWIGKRMRALYGIDAMTLHPPIAGAFPAVQWESRENGFVCVGRISPEKRLERIIDIVNGVRAKGHDVHLHIIGTDDDTDYTAAIRRAAHRSGDVIALHENLSRTELLALVAQHRYGVHAMEDEHFGMAVAEMVRAGCIVFVPHAGGPLEILGDIPRLTYRSIEDAVDKIAAMLSDGAQQRAARDHLAQRATLFSTERFIAQVRQIVAEMAA